MGEREERRAIKISMHTTLCFSVSFIKEYGTKILAKTLDKLKTPDLQQIKNGPLLPQENFQIIFTSLSMSEEGGNREGRKREEKEERRRKKEEREEKEEGKRVERKRNGRKEKEGMV